MVDLIAVEGNPDPGSVPVKIAIAGPGGAAAPVPGTDINSPSHVVGELITVSNTWTRPNNVDAYVANDVVGSLIELPNFARVNGGSGYFVKCRLSTNKKSITPRIRVHLFSASNPTVAADNAQMKELFADRDKRLGYFDLPAMTTAADAGNSDCSRSFDLNLRIAFVCGATSRSIWVLMETLDGISPDALQIWAITMVGDLN